MGGVHWTAAAAQEGWICWRAVVAMMRQRAVLEVDGEEGGSSALGKGSMEGRWCAAVGCGGVRRSRGGGCCLGWLRCGARPEEEDPSCCCDGLEDEQAHMVKSSGRLLCRGFGNYRGCLRLDRGLCATIVTVAGVRGDGGLMRLGSGGGSGENVGVSAVKGRRI